MIDIKNKDNCCGCSACASICPKQCIVMKPDSEGFLYPQADKSTCIDCRLCEKVCNELHPYKKRLPIKVLAAVNKDETIRQKSSSGGVFYLLAEKTIREGGVVFGARFDNNWQVVIDYAEDLKGIEAFMGSKYVQARIDNAYKDVKYFLGLNRKVLFSGTPCQVAGLHKYLRKSYSNLVTVDFICHGTPSPRVWGEYLNEVIKVGIRLNKIDFRNKTNGWKNFSFNIMYDQEGKVMSLLSPYSQNLYMKAFLTDIILRPSCYNCKAKECSSQSDITIADFWGINTIFPEMDDDKGTGLVLINSNKGKTSIDFSQLIIAETTFDKIKPLNPACYRSPKVNPRRKDFFARLDSECVLDLMEECTKVSFLTRMLIPVWRCLFSIKRMWGGQTYNKETKPIVVYPLDYTIVSISFRNKSLGWKDYMIEIKIEKNENSNNNTTS